METKRCFKCGTKKDRAEFYRHPMMSDGLLGKCKDCTRKDVRENRDKRVAYYRAWDRNRTRDRSVVSDYQRRYRAAHRDRYLARQKLAYAIRTGRVERKPCEVCGAANVHGHHTDYSKPLDVRWLCKDHHFNEHRRDDLKV